MNLARVLPIATALASAVLVNALVMYDASFVS